MLRMMTVHNLSQALLTAALLLTSAPEELFAQWPAYPTTGVPKTADGKPNLAGPVPRAADGKPDLSGIWQYMRPPGSPAPEPAGPAAAQDRDIIPLAVRRSQFWNL